MPTKITIPRRVVGDCYLFNHDLFPISDIHALSEAGGIDLTTTKIVDVGISAISLEATDSRGIIWYRSRSEEHTSELQSLS